LVVFRREGAVDHSQVAQSALQALGENDAPTDLALRLDYSIEHILVDEFQDTAINQYELLEKLTRGWHEHNAANPDAPRTLMIVGDAMQSIYGFRNANVGLFLQARRDGFNGVIPKHLKLASNFRSQQGIVNWVNDTFAQAFPSEDDITAARVRYSPATAVLDPGEGSAVMLDSFRGEDAQAREAESICERIAERVAAGEKGIAVLGRQRSHLLPITSRLKARGIDYQAQELDSLAHSPVVADLMTLCRVLASDDDRLSFLALLRAPWCGLQLADLHVVANFGEDAPLSPLRLVLADPTLDAALSAEGRTRLAHVRAALLWAEHTRDRLDLRVWVEATWLRLGGPRAANSDLALEDAESFLQLLELAQAEGTGLDVAWLQRQVERRFMSGGDGSCAVQVMTLHKAKGLEFDRVFIPRLNGVPRGDDGELMLWDERSIDGQRAFLLAANDRSEATAPTLYNYLRAQRKEKTRLENTRLLYVGATRAIRHLHLSATINWDERKDEPKPPPVSSLLHSIWAVFRHSMQVHDAVPLAGATQQEQQRLTRLSRDSLPSPAVLPAVAYPEDNQPDRADNLFDRAVGTVVHLAMEQLSRRGELPPAVAATDEARWRAALQEQGLWGDKLDEALALVRDSVAASLDAAGDGRWVLSDAHGEARSEWRLSQLTSGGAASDLIIDRTFIDNATGVRWIIDYKNSSPREGEDWSVFASREAEHYSEQLRRYRDALRECGDEPLQCALFFTVRGVLHPLPDLALD
ncbi:MAG: UvrD-helicase domain-containing protein, partial [Halioglobus sp.]|nr:UvrD-helicase domain-containing protein [Halioglobus sp.]